MSSDNINEKREETSNSPRPDGPASPTPGPVEQIASATPASGAAPPAHSRHRKFLRSPAHLPAGRRTLACFKNVVVRVYSLGILLLLCWAGWLVATYLRNTVFRPTQIPPHLLEWQGRVDVAALHQQNVSGMTDSAGRAPLGHYHGVDRWFQPDAGNTCTTAGCHEPLPHTTKMKVPAFANFHTTFLACQMCHTDILNNKAHAAHVVWFNLTTGEVHDVPPVLALLRYLDTHRDEIANKPAVAHQVITDLLGRTLRSVGEDRPLDALLTQLQSVAPGGPVWRQTVEQLILELPLHARGEYGAKLAPLGARDSSTQAARQMASLTVQYLAMPPGTEQNGVKDTLHAPLLKEAVSCVACHDEQAPLLDFEAIGYSPQRAAALRKLPLARLMQKIREGERFYIPEILDAK